MAKTFKAILGGRGVQVWDDRTFTIVAEFDISDMAAARSLADERNAALASAELVREWLRLHNGDAEGVARWMRDSLRLGTLRECRALVAAAGAQ